jgi:hypothetical protein
MFFQIILLSFFGVLSVIFELRKQMGLWNTVLGEEEALTSKRDFENRQTS